MAIKDKAQEPQESPEKLGADLRKLKRGDLLELLYDQVRDNEEKTEAVAELTEQVEHLKQRLDMKDAQIARLASRLDDKDARISELQEANDLYARTVDVLDLRELLKYQEKAIMEYLFSVAEKRLEE